MVFQLDQSTSSTPPDNTWDTKMPPDKSSLLTLLLDYLKINTTKSVSLKDKKLLTPASPTASK